MIEVGVAGTLVLLILRSVFDFLKERKTTQPYHVLEKIKSMEKIQAGVAKQIRDLYDWHAVTDEDGVKVWYVRRSLEQAIRELSANIAEQTKATVLIVSRLESMQGSITRLERRTGE